MGRGGLNTYSQILTFIESKIGGTISLSVSLSIWFKWKGRNESQI